MDSNEKWYSVKEFANSFGTVPGTNHPSNMSEDSVIRWINKGRLKSLWFPCDSNRRKRKYFKRLIPESERQRFIREHMK